MTKCSESHRKVKRLRVEGVRQDFIDLMDWVGERQAHLTVRNNHQHYILIYKRQRIEWWPSTGKIAFNGDYRNAKRAFDVAKFLSIVEKRLP